MANNVMIVVMLVLVIISGITQNAVGLCACSTALGFFLNAHVTEMFIIKKNEKDKEEQGGI